MSAGIVPEHSRGRRFRSLCRDPLFRLRTPRARDDRTKSTLRHVRQARSAIAANRISLSFDRRPELCGDTAARRRWLLCMKPAVSLWGRVEPGRSPPGQCAALLAISGIGFFLNARCLSPTCRCRPFGSAGYGYVRSEAAAVVTFKPLAQALAETSRYSPSQSVSGVHSDGRPKGWRCRTSGHRCAAAPVYRRRRDRPLRDHVYRAHGPERASATRSKRRAGMCSAFRGRPAIDGRIGCRQKQCRSSLNPPSGVGRTAEAVLALRPRAIPLARCIFTNPNPGSTFEELNPRGLVRTTPDSARRLTDGCQLIRRVSGVLTPHVVLRKPGARCSTRRSRGAPTESRQRSGSWCSRRMMRKPSELLGAALAELLAIGRPRRPYQPCGRGAATDGPITIIGSPPLPDP